MAGTERTVSIVAVLKDLLSKPLSQIGKGAGNAAAGLRKMERESATVVQKSAQLTSRLLSVQVALQTLNSASADGSVGKFGKVLQSASQGLGTFAALASIFPNKFGLVLAAIGGATAAFRGVAAEIAAIEEKSKSLGKELDQRAAKISRQFAPSVARQLTGGPQDLTRLELDDAQTNLESTIALRREFERQLTLLEGLPDQRIQSVQQQLDRLRGFAAQGIRRSAVKEIPDLEQELARLTGERAQKVAKLTDEITRLNGVQQEQVNQVQELNNVLSEQGQFQAFVDETAKLAEQSLKVQEDLNAGKISQLDALKQEIVLAEQQITLLEQNKDLASNYNAELESRKKDLAELEGLLEILLFIEGQITDEIKKQDAERKENKKTLTEDEEFLKGIAQGVGQGFANATGALIDGLVQGDLNLKEFAANFLLQIGKMIAQAVILRAVLAGLTGVGIPLGVNRGGYIPKFAGGGVVPGPHVDRDIVDAKLTPGEFVVRQSAVDHYGVGAMHALNRRLIPRSLFNGVSSGPQVANLSGRFNEGGEIAGTGQSATHAVPAFIVPNEQALDRMLEGGANAMLRFMERHKETIGGMLGHRRL